MLVIDPTQFYFLLPEWVFADDQRADAFCHQQGDNLLAGSVQILVDAAGPPGDQALRARRCSLMAQGFL